jgi:hypothetical protein
VLFGMSLAGFFSVVTGMVSVPTGSVCMVRRLLMLSALMMLCCLVMVASSMGMMLRRFLVVFGGLLRHKGFLLVIGWLTIFTACVQKWLLQMPR